MNVKLKTFIIGCICFFGIGILSTIGVGYLLLRGTIENAQLYSQYQDSYSRLEDDYKELEQRNIALTEYNKLLEDGIDRMGKSIGIIESGTGKIKVYVERIKDGINKIEYYSDGLEQQIKSKGSGK